MYCRLLESFNETAFIEVAGNPTPFAMGMRKRIEGGRVIRMSQHGSDRIIDMALESHGIKHTLIIEMFGKGNLVLIDENGVVEQCYRIISFKNRSVQPRARYSYPENPAEGIWSIGEPALAKITKSILGDAKPMAALSRSISAGPLYLEDAFIRAGLNPRDAIENETQSMALAAALAQVATGLGSPSPRIYSMEGKPIDYSATPIKKYEDSAAVHTGFGSMSAMFDELVSEGRTTTEDAGLEKKKAELEASIAKQEELSKQMKADAESYRSAANLIFANMSGINAMIDYLRQNRHATLDDVRERFPQLNAKSVDLKNKRVTIDL